MTASRDTGGPVDPLPVLTHPLAGHCVLGRASPPIKPEPPALEACQGETVSALFRPFLRLETLSGALVPMPKMRMDRASRTEYIR